MGRTRTGSVEVRDHSLRLAFTYQGRRCRETLADMPPTPANIRAAHRMLDALLRQIRNGTFDYAATFPHSKFARAAAPVAVPTFGHYCDLWLKTKGRLAESSRYQYAMSLRFWRRVFDADTPITAITHGDVAAFVGSHPWSSARLCNNYLVTLRGVFALACRDRKGMDDPTVGVANMPIQHQMPDPLSRTDMARILGDLYGHYDARVGHYFTFAFDTGMRPEEIIALQWGDVDWASKTIRVERAKTFHGKVKPIKTYVARTVNLTGPALAVLEAMKPYTFLKSACIFENPDTGAPWQNEHQQREWYWKPCLKRLGIRMRRAYATRHTYATLALMAGAKPAYIAKQMGHKNTRMLFDVYARWIEGADDEAERAKLEAAFSIVPELSLKRDGKGD